MKHEWYVDFPLLEVSNSSYGLETYGTVFPCDGIADADFPIYPYNFVYVQSSKAIL